MESALDRVPLSEAALEAELDAAIAEFDSGAGYDADEMLSRVRRRFGWERT